MVLGVEVFGPVEVGLGLLRRRILETSNATLGKPLPQAVVFSDFSFVEQ